MKNIFQPKHLFVRLIFCVLLTAFGISTFAQTQTITTSGSASITVPAGITSITASAWGGGGGGSKWPRNAANTLYLKGIVGGGGCFANKELAIAGINQTISYVVGNGGAGATTSGTAGNGGSASSSNWKYFIKNFQMVNYCVHP